MHFSSPTWLWLLWLLPPLVLLSAIAASRRSAALGRFAEERFVQWLFPTRSRGRAIARGAVLTLVVGMLIAAMAGPRWGFQWEDVERRGVDIVVALDLSRSMLAKDVGTDRLTAAKRELRDLMGLLQGDRVGLVVFAGTAFTQCPLTLDYTAFGVFLDQLDPNWVPVGGTDLGAAVDTAVDTFIQGDRSSKAVILITDGEDHGGQLREAAERAKAEGVHVFVVGIGKPEGVPIPDGEGGFIKEGGKVVLSRLDEPALKELALTTGGSYVRSVQGMADLEEIYRGDIKQSLEARALGSSRQRRWEERFQWLVLPALVLLLLESMLGPTRRSRSVHSGAAAAAAALFFGAAAIPSAASAGVFSDDPFREGYHAFEDGDHNAALEHWLRAQTADPGDRNLDYSIAQAHYELGDFQASEASFRAATAATDRDLAADAWYGAGNALTQMGSYPDAISAYDACLEIRPDDDDALVNRDIAQRRYEKMLEQAQNDQEQREEQQEQQEQQQDTEASADQPPPEPGEEGQDGEQQQQQEQQQGQGYSEEQQDAQSGGDSPEDESGEEERQDQADGSDDGQADEPTPQDASEAQIGGKAEAADIDRSGAEEDAAADGEISHNTVEDLDSDTRPAEVIEGAFSEEQAEALLRVLSADQAARRAERTRREAARGRRAAQKDW